MKSKFPAIAILLFGVLTTVLVPSVALSRDRGNGDDQQAQTPREGGVPWGALSGDEQTTLQDHHRNWTGYSPAEQKKLRQGARRYLELPPGERDAVKRKQQQYQNMSPQERQQLREKYRKQRD
jgi:hypothetical protein